MSPLPLMGSLELAKIAVCETKEKKGNYSNYLPNTEHLYNKMKIQRLLKQNKFTHFQSSKTPGLRQFSCLPRSNPTQRLALNNFYPVFSTPLSSGVTKASASLRPGMLSLLWRWLLGEPCDIQYFCFPSLQSHLHLTPDICIMASLHLLSAEIQGGG